MTNSQAAQLVSILIATWPNHPVPDPHALVKSWELALHDVEMHDAERALQQYLETGRFFPAPAEIRTIVRADQPALDGQLYGRYAELRRQDQTGVLSGSDDRELSQIEHRLGISHLGSRRGSVQHLQAVAS